MAGLFDELKRRKVFRVMAAYAVFAWIALQVAEVTFEPLHLPDWALTLVVVSVIVGFPVAFVLAWVFQITPRGVERDTGPDRGEHTPVFLAAPEPKKASVAVLAFDDMSPDKDQGYLCDGIAEEILNRLAMVRSLRVASRTSSFRFKEQPADVATIGKLLNVEAVLEGSIRKADNMLRITTQLINTADGYHLWSKSYDRELCDIFEIQDEIATNVAESLELTLNCPCDINTTQNPLAFEYYLKGQSFFHRWGLRNMRFAIDMFNRAVEIDAGYARAWAALANSYAMICMYWKTCDESLAVTEQASRKALALAPDVADTHVSRGLAHVVHGRHAQAVTEFETALRLSPELFSASYFYGRVCFAQGDLEKAALLFERAESVRPDDFQAPALLRQVYHGLGRHEDAKEATVRSLQRIDRHLELNPDDSRALNLALGGLAQLGRREQLMEWAQRSLDLDGDNPDTLYNVACGYALSEEIDKALDCLERAELCGIAIAQWAEHDTDLIALHDSPRFAALMDRIRCDGVG